MKSESQLPLIGTGIAKSAFQLHLVEGETGEIQRRTNKMARTTWTVLVKEPAFDQVKWNPTEQLFLEIVKLTIAARITVDVLPAVNGGDSYRTMQEI